MACYYVRGLHLLLRAGLLLFAIILALWIAPASIVHADSPFDDPTFRPPQGGGIGSGPGATTMSLPTIPAGYIEIPPPS
jgi:hypothetical protein